MIVSKMATIFFSAKCFFATCTWHRDHEGDFCQGGGRFFHIFFFCFFPINLYLVKFILFVYCLAPPRPLLDSNPLQCPSLGKRLRKVFKEYLKSIVLISTAKAIKYTKTLAFYNFERLSPFELRPFGTGGASWSLYGNIQTQISSICQIYQFLWIDGDEQPKHLMCALQHRWNLIHENFGAHGILRAPMETIHPRKPLRKILKSSLQWRN